MNFGVIGLGVISRYYLAALDRTAGVNVRGVCDLRTEALAEHRAAGRIATEDYRQLLADPRIDAVLVNVPNDLHFGICLDALAAGKHVLCEKPLALKLEHAEALAQLAGQSKRVLFTAFHRRYNRNVQEMLAQVRSSPPIVGMRVRYCERIEDHSGPDAWYLDPRRCGGGCVADNGPNAFDLAATFLGRLELKQASFGWRGAGPAPVERQALVDLVSAEGIPVKTELDWSYQDGELKDITVDLADGTSRHADMLAGFVGWKASLWHEYEGVVEDFRDCVRSDRPAGADAVQAVRLVLQTYAAVGVTP